MQNFAILIVLHFCVDMPKQINFQGLCPSLNVGDTKLHSFFNAYDIAGKSFDKSKGIFREAEFVISPVISTRLHHVKINSQSPGKVKKPNGNICHFIFNGILYV